MPRPRPPSRIDAVATPLFGICWYGDPGTGLSIVAHCGGGGSAATGVKNTITVSTASSGEPIDDLVISTEDQVGVAIQIVKNPMTHRLGLFVGLGSKVNIYELPSGELVEEVSVGENVNAIAINSLSSRLAVGCESGLVKVFALDHISNDPTADNDDNNNTKNEPIATLEGHTKSVCAVAFALRGEDKLVSSAKDGTARVWQGEDCLGVLECSIEDPKAAPQKRQQQVLVRGCGFGDLMGDVVYSVASGRRGKAFLSRWIASPGKGYHCDERTECSPCPISAMSLSGDGGMIALGAVDGTIILWGIERWKPLMKFPEVHDLPVTCIAARPYPVPLLCDQDNDGVQMHAISASADSQLAWLTLQRKSSSSSRRSSDTNLKTMVHSFLKLAFLGWILYPIANEIKDKCEGSIYNSSSDQTLMGTLQCIRYEVLLAPTSRPGIAVSPY